jgi:hypothetical protein
VAMSSWNDGGGSLSRVDLFSGVSGIVITA